MHRFFCNRISAANNREFMHKNMYKQEVHMGSSIPVNFDNDRINEARGIIRSLEFKTT